MIVVYSLLTANKKIKCPSFIMARTGVDDASVVASITVAQCSVVCYLKHCSSIGKWPARKFLFLTPILVPLAKYQSAGACVALLEVQ